MGIWCRNLTTPLPNDMGLGRLLECPQGSQSSSRVGACTCAFLPSCSSSVTLPFAWIKGSGALPRGFPTGLSHVPPWCESILGLKVEAVLGKQVSLEWTEPSGGLWNVARPWSSSRHSSGERLLLRCDGNAGNCFPTTQGKDLTSRARRRKRGSSGCGRDSCASSRVETGMSGNFLSCSKGVKYPLEVPEVRCD